MIAAFSWDDPTVPAWIGAITGLLALAVSGAVAWVQVKQKKGLAELRKPKIAGSVTASGSNTRNAGTTLLDVQIRLSNPAFAGDTIKSSTVEFRDGITLPFTFAGKLTETGTTRDLTIGAPDLVSFIFRFTGTETLALDQKQATLSLEFLRHDTLHLPFTVGDPPFPTNRSAAPGERPLQTAD